MSNGDVPEPPVTWRPIDPATFSTPKPGPSDLAIATFVLGILAIPTGGLTGIAAVITGIFEFGNIRAGRSSRAGLVWNTTGFVLAILVVLVLIIFWVFFMRFAGTIMNDINSMAVGAGKTK